VLKCYNPEAFTGGTDTESDELLRARILESFDSLPTGSNKAFYEAEALKVVAVSVLAKNRGWVRLT